MPSETLYVDRDAVVVDIDHPMAEGGEAEIFNLQNGMVLKKYKGPDHSSFADSTAEAAANRKAATARLLEIQNKLPKLISFSLPAHIAAPAQLVYDSKSASRRVVGYTMPFVDQATRLREFANVDARQRANISQNEVVDVFAGLHDTVSAVHQQKLVIGDFNNLNVLVKGKEAFLLDADSFSLPGFPCLSFTSRYIDPRICRTNQKSAEMAKPHSPETDWYAFALHFWETLLGVYFYGGVFKPADQSERVGPDERPLKAISVMDPRVKYPQAAIQYTVLPGPVIDYYRALLAGERKPLPKDLLLALRFDNGVGYVTAPPVLVQPSIDGSGVSVRIIFETSGIIMHAAIMAGKLRYAYHEDGAFRTESGSVLDGERTPGMTVQLQGYKGLIAAQGGKAFLLNSGEKPQLISADQFLGREPALAANGENHYWTAAGYLWRNSENGPKQICEVITGQTKIFVGEKFGFAYSLAGGLRRAFLFDAQPNSKRTVDFKVVAGNLIDVACYFSEHRVWVIAAINENGQIKHRCSLIGTDGEILAQAEAIEGDDSWLGALTGKCAASFPLNNGGTLEALLCATADGIVQVERKDKNLTVTRTFAGTAGLVDSSNTLLFSNQGLHVCSRQSIRLITTHR